MRPVRFVALSEDGQAFVLADEVGRLLALPIDHRVQGALRSDRNGGDGDGSTPHHHAGSHATLSPRDIQARIRSGESAEDVARVAGVPVDRVLRYAGPVLQERAMLAQHARRTKLRTSDKGASLAEVVDARLAQHGVDSEKISWDAYRREDGTWRIVATWPSGKATAQAVWELDKARQVVSPQDDMAQYLCTERPTHILGQDPPVDRPLRGESSRGELGRGDSGRGDSTRGDSTRGDLGRGDSNRGDSSRGDSSRGNLRRNEPSRGELGRTPAREDSGRDSSGREDSGRNEGTGNEAAARNDSGRGHEPTRPPADPPRRETRPGRGLGPDPIRAGRDALLASLDRPLGSPRRDTQEAPGRDRGAVAARESGGLAAKPAAPPAQTPSAPAAESGTPRRPARGAAGLIGKPVGSAFDDDRDAPQDVPAVPSLAVLRPRRTGQSAPEETEQPRKRLPSWDDVLFGGSPAARESS
ncbi:MAG TPA: septation protein SepH [Micromonosporaceae bacterium]|nr:septation protein SepH [Micromonosporaceae bacterium]